MSLSNILESNNPVTPQPWTLLHAQRYKGLSLDVGKLENVVTVNGDPISEYKLQIDNSVGPGSELLTEIAPRNYQIKTLQAGSGITLTDNPTNVEIASVASVAANGYVAYQSAVPDPAPNGVAPTNVWLPVQTLTVSGTILPSSKLVIVYDGWWINPDPAATVTGQFIIYVTSPSAVVTTSQLTISVLRQSLPTVTDFMATQSQNYVMPITQLGNYTIEVRGSTALSATASGMWNFYAYVTN